MKKVKFLMSIGCLLVASSIWAQTTVTGTVTDLDNLPLPGTSVVEQGTSNGTTTDFDGNFSIETSEDAVLEFSYLGYATQEVPVNDQTSLQVSLTEDAAQLDEVVLVGYGSQRKKDLTGAVTSVKSEDFNQGVVTSPEQLIQGKVSGVNVTGASGEPGSGQNITIRGVGSVRSGSTPLFVVDGFALDNSSTGAPTNPLNFINPQDIESIDILKDASATAIYGSRGANGVVLITTKKGKSGISTMQISSNIGISNISREIDVFNAEEFRTNVVAIGGELVDLGGDTNWQDEVTRAALSHNQNLIFSGGTDKLTYYASLGVQDQQGVLLKSGLKRYSGRVNITQKLFNDRLKIDFNMNVTRTNTERPPIGTLVGDALTLNPTYPARDANGNPAIYPDVFNPLIRSNLYDDITNTRRIIGNITPSLEIIDGLVYKLNFGIDNSSADRDVQNNPSTTPFEQGSLESFFNNNRNVLIENYITYNFDLNDVHAFSILAGHSYQNIFVQQRRWYIDNFADTGIEPRYNPGLGQEIDLADDNERPSGYAFKNELQSFFGRVNYNYRDRYLIDATVRADGSSKFGENNKYGVFPSFAAAWRISEENFMGDSSIFSNLKLRAGWGQTGNQEIPPKITKALFTSEVSGGTSYPLDNSENYPAGTTFTRFANPDIQWEVSTQTNVGL
ncbi:MAG TPA: SusC/RagA family TonB-linked outer membrane protein, partial [Pricia sp.]|nr:SusC/RagA family TonB-linked outer membrane protein [Pricia sp.]